MAQSVGYGLSAIGPVLFGGLHDLTGSWTAPLITIAAAMAVLTLIGSLAGRDRVIGG
jgi:MFS transporter, CP family, cyanate transporter